MAARKTTTKSSFVKADAFLNLTCVVGDSKVRIGGIALHLGSESAKGKWHTRLMANPRLH